MGKNKKKKNQQQPQEAVEAVKTEEPKIQKDQCCEDKTCNENHETDEEKKQEVVPEEEKKTPQERADEFKESSMKIHNNFVEKFKKDWEAIEEDPGIEEKQVKLKEREVTEFKKLDKIIKKEREDFENIGGAGATNAKQIHDKILRTIANMRKVSSQHAEIKKQTDDHQIGIDSSKKDIESSIKKKKMLEMICLQFLNQNYDLYLQHETMLDMENQKRKDLADGFQEKMKGLSEVINEQKVERQKAFEENQQIRDTIAKAVEDYKVKEDNYRTKMDEFNTKIQAVQDSLQTEMSTGSLGKTSKLVEAEKKDYEKIMANIKNLSEEIQQFVKRFDGVKEEIDCSNKKFETYKLEIDTKKQQIALLETQIQNIMLMGQLRDKTKNDINEEKAMLLKQVNTLKSLESALNIQLGALQ